MLRKVSGLCAGFVELSLQLIDAPVVAPAVLCKMRRLSTCVFQLPLELRNFEPAQCRVRVPVWPLVVVCTQLALPRRRRPIARTRANLRRAPATWGSPPQARAACGSDLEGIARAGTACGGGSLGSRYTRAACSADMAVALAR